MKEPISLVRYTLYHACETCLDDIYEVRRQGVDMQGVLFPLLNSEKCQDLYNILQNFPTSADYHIPADVHAPEPLTYTSNK